MIKKRFLPLLKCFLYISILLISFCNLTQAQSGATTGTVLGTASDQQSAVISGVTITIRNLDTNFTRTTQTNEKGIYQIPQLPPGQYQIEAIRDDFSKKTETLIISIGITALIDFVLFPTSTSDVVVVSSDNLDQEKTETSTFINQRKIASLPASRRNFLDFAILSPKVTPDRTPSIGISSGSGLSINGQIGRFNNITIDGLDNNDSGTGSVRSTFAQEAVREFQVVSDGFSAEFGRTLAGIINIVTKSGTNDYHTNLFLFYRDEKLSARNTFFTQKNPFTQYQFGIVLSGPIKKDKLFFFSSLERLTTKDSLFIPIPQFIVDSIDNQGFSIRNGIIPFSIGTTSTLLRLDGKLTNNNIFWLRYNGGFSYNGQFEPNLGRGNNLESDSSNGKLQLNDNSLAFNNTYLNANLNLVNETRFLFGRRDQKVLELSPSPFIQVDGGATFGRGITLPQTRLEYIYQLVNNTTLISGKHQIKFGLDLQHIFSPDGGTNIFNVKGGAYVFSGLDFSNLFQRPGLPTLTAFEAFDPNLRTTAQKAFLNFAATLLPSLVPGFPTNIPLAELPLPLFFGQGFGKPTEKLTANFFSSFVQDSFRPTSNLLLNIGLRYDINRVRFAPNNSGNFSPRIGVSYLPLKKILPQLKIQATYGLFFGSPFTGPILQSHLYSSSKYKMLALVPPFSILPYLLPGHAFSDNSTLPTTVPFTPQYAIEFQYQANAKNSYSQQTSFGINYSLNAQSSFSIAYNYLRGIKLFSRREINPVVRPIPGDLLGGFLRGRPDNSRGSVLEYENASDSYFHGVTFSFSSQFNNKLELLTSYTYSKSIDNITGFLSNEVIEDANDPLNLRGERGLSSSDLRSRFILSSTWQLPINKNKWLKDFSLSSIISLNSGRPYNLRAGLDLNMNDSNGDRPTGIGRNAGVTAGFASVDLRLQRIFSYQDKYKLQLIIEAFNLFNRVNFDPDAIRKNFLPDKNGNFYLPSKQGNRFSAPKENYFRAFTPRQFQLGIKLSF